MRSRGHAPSSNGYVGLRGGPGNGPMGISPGTSTAALTSEHQDRGERGGIACGYPPRGRRDCSCILLHAALCLAAAHRCHNRASTCASTSPSASTSNCPSASASNSASTNGTVANRPMAGVARQGVQDTHRGLLAYPCGLRGPSQGREGLAGDACGCPAGGSGGMQEVWDSSLAASRPPLSKACPKVQLMIKTAQGRDAAVLALDHRERRNYNGWRRKRPCWWLRWWSLRRWA